MAKSWAKAFYNSRAWQTARRIALKRDHYTCHDCYARASEVHHIQELTPDNINDPHISLNPDNLVSYCHACHTKITQGDTGDLNDGLCFDDNGQVIEI